MDLHRLKIDRPSSPPRQTARKRSRWIWRLVLLAVLGVLAWLFRSPLGVWVDRFRLPAVEVERVTERSLAAAGATTGAASNGYIVARTRAALSADTPGRIVEMNVREGQAVKKGFVVARLYADEYAAALRQAEADLVVGESNVKKSQAEVAAAEDEVRRLEAMQAAVAAALDEARADERVAAQNHARIRDLVAGKVESERALDEAQAALDAARARVVSGQANVTAAGQALAQGKSRLGVARAVVEQETSRLDVLRAGRDLARATLDKTELRAPFDGIVVLKDAEVGEVVSPNVQAGSSARGSVVTMVDFNSLEVQAEVPETSIAQVKLGAPVRVFLDAYPDRPYSGRVDRIWPTASRQKATIEVRAVFDHPDERLRPEMGVRVVFLEGEQPAQAVEGTASGAVILVPEDAVVRQDGRTAVFVLERDIARLREVEVGGRSSSRVVVERGLTPDELVVRKPPPRLKDGERVRLKEP